MDKGSGVCFVRLKGELGYFGGKKLAANAPSSYCFGPWSPTALLFVRQIRAAARRARCGVGVKVEESVGGRLAENNLRSYVRLPVSIKSQVDERVERAPRGFR